MYTVNNLDSPCYDIWILNTTDLTLNDVLYLTPKFWKLHREPIVALDGAAFTLLSIQTNLFVGTLGPFASKRPELQPIIQSALNFDISLVYLFLHFQRLTLSMSF